MSAGPMFVPSTMNCTSLMPLASVALAPTPITPVTVEPAAGVVRPTAGPCLSVFWT